MSNLRPGNTRGPLTPGLQFNRHWDPDPYPSKDPITPIEKAVHTVRRNLQNLNRLDALVALTIDNEKTIWIDGRGAGPARIHTALPPDSPAASLWLESHDIVAFGEGQAEPRWTMSIASSSLKLLGEMCVAIRFADLLNRVRPKDVEKYELGTQWLSPPVITTIHQLHIQLSEVGYSWTRDSLSPEQVAILYKAVDQQFELEWGPNDKPEYQLYHEAPDQPCLRIHALANKGDAFLDLLNHPLIDEVVPWQLGRLAHVHSYYAEKVMPERVMPPLYTEQMAIQPQSDDFALGLSITWFLTDVDEDTGGTHIYPWSHKPVTAPRSIRDVEGSFVPTGPAGTALVQDARLWRAPGFNPSEKGRVSITIVFMRSFVRQRENYGLSVPKHVASKLSDRQKRLLGFSSTGTLGGVDGDVRERIVEKRGKDRVRGKDRARGKDRVTTRITA
ncbi:hypothetical protein F5Y18DRAFT_417133 [Xylariaceae sp. FL1019]|nr:hypothetical protein F5Y18DRAFT_417133 [Xylariaceae sp. FL1019]